MTTVSLENLLKKITPISVHPGDASAFEGITNHSGQVKPGALFCAVSGTQTNGLLFLKEAVHKGAAGVIVAQNDFSQVQAEFPQLTCIGVTDVRLSLAQALPLFFPKKPTFMAAITGTNGKTSTAHFTRQLWGALGLKAASLGTLGLALEKAALTPMPDLPPGFATLDPVLFHTCLTLLAETGINHCVLEASSHGIDQKRLHGVAFDVGVFTSFSRDHLDYHSDMDAYGKAKCGLFTELMPAGSVALLNAELPQVKALQQLCEERKLKTWVYGVEGKDLTLLKRTPTPTGQHIQCRLFGEEYSFFLPLCGAFQVDNFLAAMGIVHASGFAISDILAAHTQITPVPGRLEGVGTTPSGGHVYVDYAHTPDALARALQNLRPHTTGQLHVVFGCGGDRDKGKRPEMGDIAQKFADKVIVTDDNPRSESPEAIRASILSACPEAQETGNRRRAIDTSIRALRSGDVLLIAGKGHETYQIIGTQSIPFDDRLVAQEMITMLTQKEEHSCNRF